MLLALLLALSVALALAYFAKAVLVRTPSRTPESDQFGTTFSSAISSNQAPSQLRKRTQISSTNQPDNTEEYQQPKLVMQPPLQNLEPPKDTPFTIKELAAFDGSDPSKLIYVAIKGTIFDVTRKTDVYGKGKSYNLFAGQDASRALGMSSLKEEDAVSDYSTLSEGDMKTLNDWDAFFRKRYNVDGKVIDLPPMSNSLPPPPKTEDSSAPATSSAL